MAESSDTGDQLNMACINTEKFSSELRRRSVLPAERKVLVARLAGSDQEKDLSAPVNCRGYGRIRHFRLLPHGDWSPDPLPILPAAKALHYPAGRQVRAQVFQIGSCNWRCWYCFVDTNRLSADVGVSDFLSADELVDLFLAEEERPEILDLSGGQPDLVPEWTLWMAEAIERRGLAGKVFLWSDDNLSTRYHWEYLTPSQRRYLAEFPASGRVACFKGYDQHSFAFNTLASPELFPLQFEYFRALLEDGHDLYSYVTFTGPPNPHLHDDMRTFVDNLQDISRLLPLRAVPLKISVFTPTGRRMRRQHEEAIRFQDEAHAAWLSELSGRFTPMERSLPITEVSL